MMQNILRTRRPATWVLSLVCLLVVSVDYKISQGADVSFDERGYMLVDGEPEFPVGIYVAIRPDMLGSDPQRVLAKLDDLKDSPFDVLVNYGGPDGTPDERLQYLDELHKRGLREMFSFKDYFAKGTWGESIYLKGETEQEAISRDIEPLKNHPAILGWYISDEETDESNVRRHHQWVKDEDPSRPTLALYIWSGIESDTVASSGDIIATDPYPIPNDPIAHVAAYTDQLRKVTGGNRPMWVVLQDFGWYMYREDFDEVPEASLSPTVVREGRAPTPREMRCMTYLSLTHGATGIIFYYYKDIKRAYDTETRWSTAKSIGREVKDISPILLAPDVEANTIAGDNEHIHWKAKRLDGKIYIIAVNASTQVQSTILTLPATIEAATIQKGVGMAYPQYNELLLTLDGYEAVVVELVSN